MRVERLVDERARKMRMTRKGKNRVSIENACIEFSTECTHRLLHLRARCTI